jgi:hypothetical protein
MRLHQILRGKDIDGRQFLRIDAIYDLQAIDVFCTDMFFFDNEPIADTIEKLRAMADLLERELQA